MRIWRAAGLGAMVCAGFALSGCATIEGAPRRVIDEPMSMKLVGRYAIDQAITNFSYPDRDSYNWAYREGLTRRQYRDMVVTVYMNAMDSRYHEFRTALSSERRQADFGMDLAVLGFTGWASVAKASIVNNLSAVAAGFAGARGVVAKDLYFDKAVPAIIAAMDADRLRARAQMVTSLQKPAGDYPLQTAFGDLMGYEVASTLDGAITRITAEATQDREEAQAELALAQTACIAEEGAEDVASKLVRYIDRFQPDPATGQISNANLMKLSQIASAIGAPIGWTTAEELYDAIIGHVMAGKEGQCSKSNLEAMVTKVETAMKEKL